MRIIVLLILIFLSACSSNQDRASVINQKIVDFSQSESNSKYYLVTKVVDGDTIYVDIDGEEKAIRLIGINTPETVDPRRLVECFGKEASERAKELLLGKTVSLLTDDSQENIDKYGRLLRYAKIKDDFFYNLEIIKQGYAFEYTYKYPYKYQADFLKAQDYAKSNELGLWKPGACE